MTKQHNELWAYDNMLFTDEEEAKTWIAQYEFYMGEEGLMNIFESGDLYEIENFQDLLEWCKENGYEATNIHKDFGIDIGWLLK